MSEGHPVTDGSRPRNLVVVLLDSLNRHMLGAYGGGEFDTPNLDRFATQRAVRFTRHVTGSLPCMPARHDILCGTMDFLWRPWGSIELWDEPITRRLRPAGVTTMLVSDHPHLFESGGENYHCEFVGWDYERGHESDPWRTYVDTSWLGAPALPARDGLWYFAERMGAGFLRDLGVGSGVLEKKPALPLRPYDRSRTFFREEEDFPGPKTMTAAADWIRRAAPAHDRWMLFVDEFDPHEPFDTPERWARRYDPDWEGELLIWPPYDVGPVAEGRLSEREAHQIRANYGAKLSMIDEWFGRILAALDEGDLWDSTAVIVCTDHGHYLGEKDIWGKPRVIQYEAIGHTPLLIHWPGVPGGSSCDALTTAVDIHATIADVFGVDPGPEGQGMSLVPLLTGDADRIREWAVGGVFGNWVQVTDGRRKYARGAAGDNFPLSMWSNRWSTLGHGMGPNLVLPPPDGRARLDYMPHSEIPVIRQPFAPGDRIPFWASDACVDRHFLFDLDLDPGEDENLVGTGVETELLELLHVALKALEAPSDQLERLGIA